QALAAIDVNLAPDLDSRLFNPQLRDVGAAFADHQPRRAPTGAGLVLGHGGHGQPCFATLWQAGRDRKLYPELLGKPRALRPQVVVDLLLQILAEEFAVEDSRAVLFHAAHRHSDQIEGEHLLRARAITLLTDLVEHCEADLR